MVLPVPFTSLAAAVVYYGLFIAFLAVESVMIRHSRASTAPAHDRGTGRFLMSAIAGGIGLGYLIVFLVPDAVVPGPREAIFVAGAVIASTGISLRWWSIHTLGRFFTGTVRIADDHQVISDGPYRLVRHPGYLASLITFVGLGLELGNWLTVIVTVAVPLIGYLRRITTEEQVLAVRLGIAYQDYAHSRARLVPFLW